MTSDDRRDCPECGNNQVSKFGFDRNGRQRFRCKKCGTTFGTKSHGPDRRIGKVKEEQIERLLAAGVSSRSIAGILSVSKNTVTVRANQRTPVEDLHTPIIPGPGCCHYCGRQLQGQREYDRKTRRTNHAFCNQKCYIKFRLVTDPNRLSAYLERKLKRDQEQ